MQATSATRLPALAFLPPAPSSARTPPHGVPPAHRAQGDPVAAGLTRLPAARGEAMDIARSEAEERQEQEEYAREEGEVDGRDPRDARGASPAPSSGSEISDGDPPGYIPGVGFASTSSNYINPTTYPAFAPAPLAPPASSTAMSVSTSTTAASTSTTPTVPPPKTSKRGFDELEVGTFENPKEFFSKALAIAATRGVSLLVWNNSSHKSWAAFMHITCVYRNSGCPFILRLAKNKDGVWFMKSNKTEVPVAQRSVYRCKHAPDAVPQTASDLSSLAKRKPTAQPGAAATKTKMIKMTKGAGASGSGSVKVKGVGGVARLVSGTGASLGTPGKAARISSPPGSSTSTSGHSKPTNPSPLASSSSSPPTLVYLKSSPNSANRDAVLAPPFERSNYMETQITPVLQPPPPPPLPTPAPTEVSPAPVLAPLQPTSTTSVDPPQSPAVRNVEIGPNGRPYLSSDGIPSLSIPELFERLLPLPFALPLSPLPSGTPRFPVARLSPTLPLASDPLPLPSQPPYLNSLVPPTSTSFDARSPSVEPHPSFSLCPPPSLPAPEPIVPPPPASLPAWKKFLSRLDPELIPLAKVLSAPTLAVSPKSFFEEDEEMRLMFIDALNADEVGLWPKLKLRRKVLKEGERVWKEIVSEEEEKEEKETDLGKEKLVSTGGDGAEPKGEESQNDRIKMEGVEQEHVAAATVAEKVADPVGLPADTTSIAPSPLRIMTVADLGDESSSDEDHEVAQSLTLIRAVASGSASSPPEIESAKGVRTKLDGLAKSSTLGNGIAPQIKVETVEKRGVRVPVGSSSQNRVAEQTQSSAHGGEGCTLIDEPMELGASTGDFGDLLITAADSAPSRSSASTPAPLNIRRGVGSPSQPPSSPIIVSQADSRLIPRIPRPPSPPPRPSHIPPPLKGPGNPDLLPPRPEPTTLAPSYPHLPPTPHHSIPPGPMNFVDPRGGHPTSMRDPAGQRFDANRGGGAGVGRGGFNGNRGNFAGNQGAYGNFANRGGYGVGDGVRVGGYFNGNGEGALNGHNGGGSYLNGAYMPPQPQGSPIYPSATPPTSSSSARFQPSNRWNGSTPSPNPNPRGSRSPGS